MSRAFTELGVRALGALAKKGGQALEDPNTRGRIATGARRAASAGTDLAVGANPVLGQLLALAQKGIEGQSTPAEAAPATQSGNAPTTTQGQPDPSAPQSFESLQADIFLKEAEKAARQEAQESIKTLGAKKVFEEASAAKTEAEAQPVAQALAGASVPKQPQAQGGIAGLINKLIGPGSTLEQLGSGGARRNLEREQAATLRREREVGLTAAEREKAGIDYANEGVKLFNKRRDELFKAFEEPTTAETGKALSQIESALTGIDNINSLLGISLDSETGQINIANADLLKNVNFLSKNRQALKRARDVFINKGLRRDSGAAIGDKEIKEFKRTFGFDIGMKAFMQNPEVIAKSILESQDQLTRDRNRLVPNEARDSLIRQLQALGHNKDEIAAEFERRGQL